MTLTVLAPDAPAGATAAILVSDRIAKLVALVAPKLTVDAKERPDPSI